MPWACDLLSFFGGDALADVSSYVFSSQTKNHLERAYPLHFTSLSPPQSLSSHQYGLHFLDSSPHFLVINAFLWTQMLEKKPPGLISVCRLLCPMLSHGSNSAGFFPARIFRYEIVLLDSTDWHGSQSIHIAPDLEGNSNQLQSVMDLGHLRGCAPLSLG